MRALRILGLQPCDKAVMLDDNTIEFFVRNLYEMGLNSQRRETLLFVSSDVATMTSRANQQYEHLLIKTPSKEVQQSINTINECSSIFPYTSPFKYAISTQHFPKCCFTYTVNALRNTSSCFFTFYYVRVLVNDINRFAYIE